MLIALTPRRLKIGAAVLTLAVAALIVDRLYESDKDKINAVIDRMVVAVEEGRPEDIAVELTHDFLQSGFSREDIIETAKAYFDIYGETSVAVMSRNIRVSGQIASVEVVARVGIGGSSFGRASTSTQWQLGLVYSDDRWSVDRIVPVSVGSRDVFDLNSLRQMLGRFP